MTVDLVRVFLGVVSLFVAANAGAQSAKVPPPWPQEPNSFLGIRFDRALEAQIPACDAVSASVAIGRPMCYRKPLSPRVTLENLPDLGIPLREATVDIRENRPGIISVMVPHESEFFMLQTLETRYGKPHRERNNSGQNAAGGVSPATNFYWKGRHVEISFGPDSMGLLDGSLLVVASRDVMRAASESYDSTVRKAAGKL